MKSIGLFESKFLELLEMSNVAGGVGSVFGVAAAGQFGNQFPSQNDLAYAPGDARIPKILGSKKRKKKVKQIIQRRPLPGLEF